MVEESRSRGVEVLRVEGEAAADYEWMVLT